MASPNREVLPLISLLFSLFCLIETNYGESIVSTVNEGLEAQREFDYFLLSLQWPGTVCRRTRHCCASNGCCRRSNAPAGFTIHGLWSNYNDGTWPACCSGPSFDIKEISPLLEGLQKYWPSLSCSSSSTCHSKKGLFWAHERSMGLAHLQLLEMNTAIS
ncbi:hypothetical protein Syun_030274 [Stephania yunnanensis]|uniref:Uncharacterized protein n=1 Tax=Stephania yunnanensis TaxID=152371 RepID=A0AAP0E702_9MAGN